MAHLSTTPLIRRNVSTTGLPEIKTHRVSPRFVITSVMSEYVQGLPPQDIVHLHQKTANDIDWILRLPAPPDAGIKPLGDRCAHLMSGRRCCCSHIMRQIYLRSCFRPLSSRSSFRLTVGQVTSTTRFDGIRFVTVRILSVLFSCRPLLGPLLDILPRVLHTHIFDGTPPSGQKSKMLSDRGIGVASRNIVNDVKARRRA